MVNHYSTQSISEKLLKEVVHALQTVSPYGSVEIFVQNNVVTQITIRNIRKTNSHLTNQDIDKPELYKRK